MDDNYEIDLADLLAALGDRDEADLSKIEIGPTLRNRYLQTLGRCIEENLFGWDLLEADGDKMTLAAMVPYGDDYIVSLEIMDTYTVEGFIHALVPLKRLEDYFRPEVYMKKFDDQKQAEINIEHIKERFAELEEWLSLNGTEELYEAFVEQGLPPIL